MASTEAPPTRHYEVTQPHPAQPTTFPGCKPVHLPRTEIERFEGRLEYWDAATETAWICDPTTPCHERPSRLLTRLAERIAGVRGSPIESYGSMDLLLRDADGTPRRIMQADESVYLHPARARPGPAAMVIGEDDFPDVVLEVDHTTDVHRGKLALYESWGFPEVWVEVPEAPSPSRPHRRRPGLTIHLLEHGRFRVAAESRAFPGWRAEEVHLALNEPVLSGRTCAALQPCAPGLGRACAATASAVAAAPSHTVVLKSDGTLWAWGRNASGQLGDGTATDRAGPVQVGPGNKWRAVAAGAVHAVAIRRNGTLWAWGSNGAGQLGDGTTTDRPSPVQVDGGGKWRAAAAGFGHTVAVRRDGSLWAWGRNDIGQLGDGTWENRSSPVRVGARAGWSAVAAGEAHTVALHADGTLWAWGANWSGQLGDGTTSDRAEPVRVGTQTDWSVVAAGEAHTVAVRADGTLWAWGANGVGQLGDGTTSDRAEPVRVRSGSDWRAVAAGEAHTVGLRTDGTLWAWGLNNNGQLGQRWTVRRQLEPEVVKRFRDLWNWTWDDDWDAIAAAGHGTVALKTDGTLWGWGNNEHGQLGECALTDPSCPPVNLTF